MAYNTFRFLKSDEVGMIKELYTIDPRNMGVKLTPEEIYNMSMRLANKIDKGFCKVLMMFDENNQPAAMYVGFELVKISGWYIGLTKVKTSASHFSTTAKLLSPGLSYLIEYMESKGYYKFWMAAPESWHNMRNMVMRKYCPTMARYHWFDEMIIPKGQKANVAAFDAIRPVCNWSDILVRMFSLKQEERIKILKNQGHIEYNGTLKNCLA